MEKANWNGSNVINESRIMIINIYRENFAVSHCRVEIIVENANWKGRNGIIVINTSAHY